jgi:glucose/arabinose dehydrogenase
VRCSRAAAALLLRLPLAAAAAPPFAVGGDPRVDPGDFEITVFAAGLDFPIGLAELPDGSLLVGLNRKDGPDFSLAAGELVRFVDANDDGVADGPGQTLAGGFDAVTSLRVVADLVVVAEGGRGTPSIAFLRRGPTPTSPLALLGSLDLAFAPGWLHPTLSLAVREAPGSPGLVDVFFNVGSQFNDVVSTGSVAASGLWSGSLIADSLYAARIDATGPVPAVVSLTRVASGLRNAFGIAFQPGSGDLYFQDNGIDGVFGGDPVSADELNHIPAAQIGGPAPHFGFPGNYVAYRSSVEVGSGGVDPVLVFQPVPPPNGEESEGPAEIAFAPPGFPPALRGGLFVGFHGQFSAAGLANQENPLVYADVASGGHFHFVSNDEPALGHLDSLLARGDSLFVADLTAAAGFSSFGSGALYRIRARLSACENGLDDDGDGLVDWAPDPGQGDPGCFDDEGPVEDPACQNGLDDDLDGRVDFDGGVSVNGPPGTTPDYDCVGMPHRSRERIACGLGFEVLPLLVPSLALRRVLRRGGSPRSPAS